MTSCAGRREARRATAHGTRSGRPVPTATFDEYVAGRCDRLGQDMLLDARANDHGGETLRGAVDAPPDCDLSALHRRLRRRHPDVVWVHSTDPDASGHVAAIAALVERCGADVLLIDEPTETADTVGLLRRRPSRRPESRRAVG